MFFTLIAQPYFRIYLSQPGVNVFNPPAQFRGVFAWLDYAQIIPAKNITALATRLTKAGAYG